MKRLRTIFAVSRTGGEFLTVGLMCLLFAGCASYQARPLTPAAFQAQFSARRLTNPRLEKFITRQPIRLRPDFPRVQNVTTLVLAAWYYSPALRMKLAQLAVDRANIITASQSPNPTVALSPTYAAKAGPGVSPWILGFNFNIPIETAGRRADRIAQALALARAGRYDLGQIAWNIRQSVRKALVEYIFAQKQVRLLRQQAQNTALIQRLTESRFRTGDVSRPVYTAAEIQAHQATLTLVAARGRARQLRIKLAGAMSLPNRALAHVRFSLRHIMKTPPVHALNMKRLSRTALLNRMDIQSLLAQYQAAEAALKLQIARQYPNIQLGPGYSFNQGANDFTLGFTMALPIFNQNQGAIATANAHRLFIAAELQSKQTAIITEIRAALSQYRSALRQLRAAQSIANQARAQLRATRRAFWAGADSRLALADAQLQRNTFAQSALQARLLAVLALGNLEAVLERPLKTTPIMPKGKKP